MMRVSPQFGQYGWTNPYTTYSGWQPQTYSPPPQAYYYNWSGYQYAYPPSNVAYSPVSAIKAPEAKPTVWVNRLKDMFHKREVVTYAMALRTFASEDKNLNGVADPGLGENGTFLKAIKRLPELKALGVNNIHLLPILPPGKIGKLGEINSPGSVYAPLTYTKLADELGEKGSSKPLIAQAREFVDACHRYGINVMVDVPSCASIDLSLSRPDLMSKDAKGNLLTPGDWVDIRMFVNDSPALREYYQKFFDLMVNDLNVDGFRVDVARSRTRAFWKHFISKYPEKAWLAESYTEENASPMKNMARDIPEDLYNVGFDAIYGQYHIFHNMDANQFMNYMLESEYMLRRVGKQKSMIASYYTHDDPSPMEHGGPLYVKLISAMMCVTPNTHPYIIDGLLTGDVKPLDIFNWKLRPTGKNPEIGEFLKKMIAIRQSPSYKPLLTQGRYIPLSVEQDKKDPAVISFIRRHGKRNLLIVANKDVNAYHEALIEVPNLNPTQKLNNIAPTYGKQSMFRLYPGELQVKMAPGKFYMFELNLPT